MNVPTGRSSLDCHHLPLRSSRPKRGRKWLRLGLSLFVSFGVLWVAVGLALEFCPSFSLFWGEAVQWSYPSPDGQYVASIYRGSNGALGDETLHAHLTAKVLPLKKSYSSWDAPHLIGIGKSLDATWKGPRHLVLTGCEWEDRSDSYWFGVRISYK